MCGRAAQSIVTVEKAADQLRNHKNNRKNNPDTNKKWIHKDDSVMVHNDPTIKVQQISCSAGRMSTNSTTYFTTSNLSPGCPLYVMTYDPVQNQINVSPKIWGLITKPGTYQDPLPAGQSKHFSAKMFNARSESAHEKMSFRNLIAPGKSCVIAVDGFYEWKSVDTNAVLEGKKQPYFVYRNGSDKKSFLDERSDVKSNMKGPDQNMTIEPMFIAGLCTSVQTGIIRDINDHADDELHTFTILTTNASSSLKWLHHRQPMFLHNEAEAIEWLLQPSVRFLQQYNKKVNSNENHDNFELSWYPVTKKINSVQYKGEDCMSKIKIGNGTNIKQMFEAYKAKCSAETTVSPSPKKVTKRSIETSFSNESKKTKTNLFSMGFERGSPDKAKNYKLAKTSPRKVFMSSPKNSRENNLSITNFFKKKI